eukprot:COSAG05_NODE_13449_length_430_cov_0.622356_2_plen_28_part_01
MYFIFFGRGLATTLNSEHKTNDRRFSFV